MTQQVISFHYTLTDKDGKTLDQSEQGHPLIFMSGVGQIIPGLETILIGLNNGDKKTVTIPAAEAYGVYNKDLVYQVPLTKLPTPDVKVGDMFEVGQGEQMFVVSVVAIDGDKATLNGNHPLAGQDLTFAVDLVERREATPQEVAHGHVHGTGGCAH